jgi:hypothetical protein
MTVSSGIGVLPHRAGSYFHCDTACIAEPLSVGPASCTTCRFDTLPSTLIVPKIPTVPCMRPARAKSGYVGCTLVRISAGFMSWHQGFPSRAGSSEDVGRQFSWRNLLQGRIYHRSIVIVDLHRTRKVSVAELRVLFVSHPGGTVAVGENITVLGIEAALHRRRFLTHFDTLRSMAAHLLRADRHDLPPGRDEGSAFRGHQ